MTDAAEPSDPGHVRRRSRSAVRWMFESRETGKLTVAQWPNIPLSVFLATVALRWITHPHGTLAAGLAIVGEVALAIWAAAELARGVNPFRRLLGVAVLIGQIAALAARWSG